MREIKFRAWSKLDNKMFPSVGVDDGGVTIIDTMAHGLYSVKGETVIMQYTGLLDKNGKEIYEGDILGQEQFLPWGIMWDKAGFYAYNLHNPSTLYPFESATNREVIGNIYENKDLLK